MAKSGNGVILIAGGFFLLLFVAYQSGIIEISGVNSFQSGITLQPLVSLGNQIVHSIVVITGISSALVVIGIMAVILARMWK